MALKTKKGSWVKRGSGGSYRGYEYQRAAPKNYPKTASQKKIGAAGREFGQKCKGKTGSDFRACRQEVINSMF